MTRSPKTKSNPWGYPASFLLVAAASLVCTLVHTFIEPANLVMVYLYVVVVAAVRFGRWPAIMTAILSLLSFDYFFVPPKMQFIFRETQYLITLVGFLVVAIVISSLIARSRERADVIEAKELQTASLYHLSCDLAAAADISLVLQALINNISQALKTKAVVFLLHENKLCQASISDGLTITTKDFAIAEQAFHQQQATGHGTGISSFSELLYLPLKASAEPLGVLGVQTDTHFSGDYDDHRRFVEAFANQTAAAIERIQFSQQADQAKLIQARESLERALLNSISHDLRTPLVTVTGALATLREKGQLLSESARYELLTTAEDEAARLNRFVGNLLDMTRLEAGVIKLKLELSDLQDMIGCAMASVKHRVGEHTITIHLPEIIPLVPLDQVLMTQVLINLLDNALKYSPTAGAIVINAIIKKNIVILEVENEGACLPENDLERIFDKFYRAPGPERVGGTGLGLSICKGIVEAHGGRIHAINRPSGGLKIRLEIPLSPQAIKE